MHYSVLNRATVRVANTRDLSGSVTASSINDGSREASIAVHNASPSRWVAYI